MKEFRVLMNWRCDALLALACAAFLLFVADSDSLVLFVATKGAALLLCAATYGLAHRWARAGKINEMGDAINNVEE